MRLGEEVFYEILLNLIAQAVCLIKAKNLKQYIDSSHIEAFNTDKDAKWGYKSKDFSFFGYKVHLEVTQGAFPIPVSVKVTEGNKWDGHYLVELTESACKHLSAKGKNIKEVSADAGYDSVNTAKYLLQKNITPIIAENPRSRKNSITTGQVTITAQGKLLCPAGIELCYWGREHKRGRIKFRCGLFKQKGEGCLFKNICYKTDYGPTFYFKEDMDIQNAMKAIRQSKSFKKTYNKRTVIERLFSILKNTHKLSELRFKGISKVSSHIFMSISSYVCRLIESVKLKRELLPV